MTDRIPYRPSNATEGDCFHARWCAKCSLWDVGGGEHCDIAIDSMTFQISDPEYPVEWREDGPSGPRCTAFNGDDEPLDPAAVVRPLL